MEHLRARWAEALRDLASRPGFQERSEAIFADVARRYAEPHRAYHNLVHIENTLDMVAFLRHCAIDPTAVLRAAWFHDVIYDPRAADNELRSAEYARQALVALGDRSAISVGRMIEATRDHDILNADLDTLVVLDADMAILGADPQRYVEYATAIRQEYFWVPEPRYREGRIEILKKFLSKPAVFGLPVMRRLFEQQARENMEAELKTLTEGK